MTDELFDGNIASEMTLGEAIVRGILNPPKYVLSIFSYKESLVKYEIRVKNTRNKAVKDKAEKYLEALRRALDMAVGLDVIFDKHMTGRTGKYIVFCADFDAMQEAIDKVEEWFHKVDAAPHVYSVYSLDSSTKTSFDDFKNDRDDTHLRLLFCIDALNEGVHVEDISGVILLRPTISPIIFKQQIGRALSASKTTIPVIFDIVNNIENLYSIDSIEEEMETAIRYFHEFDCDYDIVNDTFDVVDEVRECMELFNALEETLSTSWDIMFAEAKRYYEENGNLDVTQYYINENGYRIGRWVAVQRMNYQHGQSLSESRIKQLESIGIHWESREERSWNQKYEMCRRYYDEHHTLDGINKQNRILSDWLVKQRKKYREGTLSQERIDKLNTIGMKWGFDDIWEQHFEAARTYFEKHGDLDVPAKYVTDDGFPLGSWCRIIRKSYQDKLLSDEKIKRLEQIGMQWESFLIRKWLDKYEKAKRYFEENGNLNIKLSYVTDDGDRLGIWISTQRENYSKGVLTDEQIRLLEKIGMSWKRFHDKWDKAFDLAKSYVDNGGDINNVSENQTSGDMNLYRWLHAQRNNYKNGKLSEERIKRLETLGIQWELKKINGSEDMPMLMIIL
ncbi:MAG: Helicase associated domain protein [Ruminococcus flavefaciens]|nr:Helicase associated domain protein [Ruminococcus flavefaciens]